MTAPILRTSDAPGLQINAVGGLHYITGNRAPYFSLTMDRWEMHSGGRVSAGGGADHQTLLKLWPELQPLADLHLSDIDGTPMHAAANGWYWLAGAIQTTGERYHGGKDRPPVDCLEIFATHVRIPMDEARSLQAQAEQAMLGGNPYDRVYRGDGAQRGRAWLTAWCETQRPRWKAEARACIDQFGLVIYGHDWTPPPDQP